MQNSGVAKNVEIFRRFSSGTLCSRFSVRAELENVQLAFQACLVRRLLMRRRDSYSKIIVSRFHDRPSVGWSRFRGVCGYLYVVRSR
jgi:hypothetical protein